MNLLVLASVMGTLGTAPAFASTARDTLSSPRLAELRLELDAGNDLALQEFWTEMEASSVPLIEPSPSGPSQRLVTFLWRAQRTPENVVVVGPVLGSDRAKNKLDRIPGTDLWFKTYDFPAALRSIYTFYVNAPLPSLGPAAGRRHDPLNPKSFVYPADPDDPASREVVVSLLELPEAEPQPRILPRGGVPRGQAQVQRLRSRILGNERRIFAYTPPGYSAEGNPYPLLIVFDGFAYMNMVPTPTILDNLIFEGAIPPIVAILVDNPDSETRGRELDCYPPFSDFLAQELLGWIQDRFNVASDPARTVLAGSSGGGNAAACAAFRHPGVFGNVLAQSGSFFKSPEEAIGDEWVFRQAVEQPRLPLRFYLDVGRYEPLFSVNSVRHLRNLLEAKGYPLHFYEYCGGHDYSWWRGTLSRGLIFLLGDTGSSPAP